VCSSDLGSVGYIADSVDYEKSDIKELGKWFRKNLQKNMLISLGNPMVCAYNRISQFVTDYYIGSERVRIMKHKAHKIIAGLFDFFMEYEDMLPSEYKQQIEFEAQKLFVRKYENTNKDKANTENRDEIEELLIIKYLRERLEEAQNQNIVEARTDFEKSKLKYLLEGCFEIFVKQKSHGNDSGVIRNLLQILHDSHKVISIANSKTELFKLCKHVAKARIIADYIATMTDRYAEKKYNEIVSSSTTWSTSFHEK
jgi:dGTP triphosphohydrolase